MRPLASLAFCTMQTDRDRDRGHPGSSSLDAICTKIGARRAGARHGAPEDAWPALRVFLWLHGRKGALALPDTGRAGLRNGIAPPPMPDGPWPKRTRKG